MKRRILAAALFLGPLAGGPAAAAENPSWKPMVSHESYRLLTVEKAFGKFWAAGENGAVFVSPDGSFWQKKRAFTGRTIYGASFPDADIGCMVGEGGLLAVTSDGGETWLTPEIGVKEDLRAVYFGSRNAGCAVGVKGTLLITRDSGKTWERKEAGYGDSLFGVYMSAAEEIWAVGERGAILHSPDGGRTWEASRHPSGKWLYDVWFMGDTGWAVGQGGQVLRRMIGRWDEIPVGTSVNLYGVSGTSGRAVCVAGAEGQLWATENSGMSWEKKGDFSDEPITSVVFSGESAWASGPENVLLSSSDGGKTWGIYSLSRLPSFTAVAFADEAFGWVAGDSGLLWNTADGGRTWIQQSPGLRHDLTSMSALSRRLCLVAGGGAIVKSDDGGNRWREVFRLPRPSDMEAADAPELEINDVFFFDGRRGWAVGSQGIVVYTSSEGEIWKRLPQAAECALNAVWFVSPNEGFAAGEDGSIYATANGGLNWRVCGGTATGDALHDIFFVNTDHGWAAGEGGAILRTMDRGSSWKEIRVGGNVAIRQVNFVDDRHGWLVGERSVIMKTWNSGDNWIAEESPIKADFRGLQFVTPSLGWAVGDRGAIICYTLSGLTAGREPAEA